MSIYYIIMYTMNVYYININIFNNLIKILFKLYIIGNYLKFVF